MADDTIPPHSQLRLGKLVRDILLDAALLKWFATHQRPHEVAEGCTLLRRPSHAPPIVLASCI